MLVLGQRLGLLGRLRVWLGRGMSIVVVMVAAVWTAMMPLLVASRSRIDVKMGTEGVSDRLATAVGMAERGRLAQQHTRQQN